VRLDVRELARNGKLTLGKRGMLFGTIGLAQTHSGLCRNFP
jgi:hypothetical protein